MTKNESNCSACEALLIEREIIDVLHTYCLAVDSCDEEVFLALWADGATLDFGDRYTGAPVGFFASVRANRAFIEAMSHHVANIRMQVTDDKTSAKSTCGVSAIVVPKPATGRQPRVIRGTYHDHWVYERGRWAIRHRRFEKILEIALGHQ